MALISIIGTSGVGKSFLVKQLASLNCSPAFFEGEEGVIPSEIFDSIFNGSERIRLFEYFIERYKKNLRRARKVSDTGINVYVDGGSLSTYAILMNEDEKVRSALKSKVDTLVDYPSDLKVLLISSDEEIKIRIEKRGRVSEDVEVALSRAIRIQNIFIDLVKDRRDVVVFDRTGLRFDDESVLTKIDSIVKDRIKQV